MIRYKSDRQKQEYQTIDLRLQAILQFISGYAQNAFGKNITITHLHRTQAEQDGICGKNPSYQKNTWLSVHQKERGADIRTSNFEPEEIKELVGVTNAVFFYSAKK